MIGLTSYRDYFAASNIRQSSKFESICQYAFDLERALEEEVVIMATCSLKASGGFSKCDKILIFEHPLSFVGPRGFAGFTTPNVRMHFDQLKEVVAFDKDILSCNLELQRPDVWVRRMRNRRTSPKTKDWDWPTDNQLLRLFDIANGGTQTSKLKAFRESRTDQAIGDSHTSMLWSPERTINAIPAKTLYSSVRDGLSKLLPAATTKATFCFGNIDLRHHLSRRSDPEASTIELAKEYVRQGSELGLKEVDFCELLPVIDSDRSVSKSYFYKDEPHFGSPKQRSSLRDLFNSTLQKECDKYTNTRALLCPSLLTGDDGFLSKDAIEKTNGGIHLATGSYGISASTKQPNPEYVWQP